MIRNKINTLTLTLILTGLMYTQSASSQTVDNDFKLRSELSINKDLTKKLKLSIIPEIRWDNSLNPDKYLLESQLTYKPVKGLALEGAYRFITNPRDTINRIYASFCSGGHLWDKNQEMGTFSKT
jgi:hypothetical protein